LSLAGLVQESGTASWHLMNSNRSLTGDFLEVAYRMAAGQMPAAEDFFLEGDMGPLSMDGVRLKVSPASIEWSLARLGRDPAPLAYGQPAVPRGFHRPGAARSGARCSLRPAGGVSASSATVSGNGGVPEGALAAWTADRRGGFEVRLAASPALEEALAGDAALE